MEEKYISIQGVKLFAEKIANKISFFLNKLLSSDFSTFNVFLLKEEMKLLRRQEYIKKTDEIIKLIQDAEKRVNELLKMLKAHST